VSILQFQLSEFIEALNRTFKTLLSIDLEADGINGLPEFFRVDVHSRIGLYSEITKNAYGDLTEALSITGALILTLNEEMALSIAAAHSDMAVTISDSIVTDAVGEFLNMVAGGTQKKSSVLFDFSLPISVAGRGHTVRLPAGLRGEYVKLHSGSREVSLVLAQTDNIQREFQSRLK